MPTVLKADVLAAIRERAELTELEHAAMPVVVNDLFKGAESMDLDAALRSLNTCLALWVGLSGGIATAIEAEGGGSDEEPEAEQ